MLWEELTITLDTKTLLVDTEGACIVDKDQIRIGCRDTELSCIYSGGTIFWTAPTKLERCRYHQIRRSTGIVVTGSNGTETFISRDGSMIRLILRRLAGPNTTTCTSWMRSMRTRYQTHYHWER
jgi:hypothetical protein